jgi:hypothetical protein
LVTVVCDPSIDELEAVTVTPGRIAPLLSVTRPAIVAVELAPPPCARTSALRESTPVTTRHTVSHLMTISFEPES